jgi:hypothetical protein
MVTGNTEPSRYDTEGTTTMRHLRRAITILAGLTKSQLTLVGAAPSALAVRLLDQNGTGTRLSVSTATHGGMAGWEITLIGVAAALLALIAVTTIIVPPATEESK